MDVYFSKINGNLGPDKQPARLTNKDDELLALGKIHSQAVAVLNVGKEWLALDLHILKHKLEGRRIVWEASRQPGKRAKERTNRGKIEATGRQSG